MLGTISCALHAAPPETLNDEGQAGFFQTPTARPLGVGSLAFHYGNIGFAENYSFHAQPLPWVWGNFRFSNAQTGDGGSRQPGKGIDVAFRLMDEGDYFPSMVLGFNDFGGTGEKAAEYLVGSKRFFSIDIHLGLGWGRLGRRGTLRNPLADFSERYARRQTGRAEGGGRPNPQNFFTGPIALFGGIRWTPGQGPLSLLVEYEGNDYSREINNIERVVGPESPWNVGFLFHPMQGMDIKTAWLRGEELGIGVTLRSNFQDMQIDNRRVYPPKGAIPSYPTSLKEDRAKQVDSAIVERIRRELKQQDVFVTGVDSTVSEGGLKTIALWVNQSISRDLAIASARVARAVIRHTGSYYDEVVFIDMVAGIEASRVSIPLNVFHKTAAGSWTTEELVQYLRFAPAKRGVLDRAEYRDLVFYPSFASGLQPRIRSHVGSPEAFGVTQVYLSLGSTAQLTRRLSISGAVNAQLYENVGNKLDRDRQGSKLPFVRTDIRAYIREGREFYVSNLAANYFWPLGDDLYGRISAGILEEMYGGLAAEVLYRPVRKRWTVGAEVNRVRKRAFEQDFGFLDFEATTGHLNLWYELPFGNMRLHTSVGQYLAGDVGATFDLSRGFNSGARFGVFFTLTNVSAEEFGEGAFDKGFYVNIPFSVFNRRGGKGSAGFTFRPLTRDGGQKVSTGRTLYDALSDSNPNTLVDQPSDWLQ